MLFRNRSSKSKSPKLVQFPSIVPSPIKATETTTVGNNTVKTDTGKVTAVVAVMTRRNGQNNDILHTSNKQFTRKVIRVLLDSGSDGDLFFQKKGSNIHVPYLTRQVPLLWHTSNGIFRTSKVGQVDITFFEYSESKRCYVKPDIVEYDEDDPKPVYDLILGNRTMKELGVVLDFKDKTITIDEVILPMRNISNLQGSRKRRALSVNNSLAQEPASTKAATKRAVEILDAKYEKADLQAIVKDNCTHLNSTHQEKLLAILKSFEMLFDGTLGDWNTEPVSFELKEGMKPYHGRAFPVPKIHKDTLIKEVQRLVKLGVLEWQPSSVWASPTFIIPKKNNTVRFISDFREVNKRLVRKPFPIPKISVVLQEMEGFTFATALDLNMGYYTIRLGPDASKICTITLPWRIHSYKRLFMRIAGSPGIFQAKSQN